jgi:hypothetical protein
MTRRANSRIAGTLFLLYIAAGLTSMALFGRATGGADQTAARLASLVDHAALVRFTVVLTLVMFVCAVGLGVTLYALTRDQDRDLALFALCCRTAEGVIGAAGSVETLGLLTVATAAGGAADAPAANVVGGLLLAQGSLGVPISATCFALGSTAFSWLFLKARTIPVSLAWLGVLASVVLVVLLPAQIAGLAGAPVTTYMWLPMLAFEVVLALWLLIKGA